MVRGPQTIAAEGRKLASESRGTMFPDSPRRDFSSGIIVHTSPCHFKYAASTKCPSANGSMRSADHAAIRCRLPSRSKIRSMQNPASSLASKSTTVTTSSTIFAENGNASSSSSTDKKQEYCSSSSCERGENRARVVGCC